MKKDINYPVKIEQAIAKKYGDETIQHPKKDWSDEKEKLYLQQMKQFYKYESCNNEQQEVDGILISRNYLQKNQSVLVLHVILIHLNLTMMFICQNLIVVKNVISSG
jgi:hypothetical protein